MGDGTAKERRGRNRRRGLRGLVNGAHITAARQGYEERGRNERRRLTDMRTHIARTSVAAEPAQTAWRIRAAYYLHVRYITGNADICQSGERLSREAERRRDNV